MLIGNRPLVIIESPYAGSVEYNLRYLRAACRHSWERGEWPFASHGWFTTFLDDTIPEERMLGLQAGMDLHSHADLIAFYTDLGTSPGMELALDRLVREANPTDWELRFIGPAWELDDDGSSINSFEKA